MDSLQLSDCKQLKYDRHGIYSIETVFDLFKDVQLITWKNWRQTKRERIEGVSSKVAKVFEGKEIKDSIRYHVFSEKGITCVNCGITGIYFALERDIFQPTTKFHFNLYTIKDDKEMMMTVDHIIPASMGGKRVLKNLQPMCSHCNTIKGNKI